MDHEIALIWWYGLGFMLFAGIVSLIADKRRHKQGPVEEPVKRHGKKRKA